jgi:peptide/nickel transport system permease protein
VTVAAGGTLLAFAGLSFLGLGVQIPAYDWGLLLNQGLDRIDIAPMATVGPGVAIVMAGIGFQLLGDLISRAVSTPATVRRSVGLTPTTAPTSLRDDTEGAVVIAEQLTVSFGGAGGGTTPVRGVSLVVPPGQMLGVVGESGSGKTLMAMALAGLLPAGASVSAERLEFLGNDLLRRPTVQTQRVLGTRLGLVFQNPAAALNPSMKIARQLTEGARFHSGLSRRAATERAVRTLRAVAIPAPERRIRQYPHELSGGMKQRAVIAMSLMGEPALIIADEPTTALDVTVQGQILDLLRGINADTGAASVLISHDIAVVASVCDRVIVMYGGTVVEDAPVDVALRRPAHPYTHALLGAVPGMDTARDQPLTTIAGRPPDPVEFPSGCPFSPRCPLADDDCRRELPVLSELSVGHRVACRHPLTADHVDEQVHRVGTG